MVLASTGAEPMIVGNITELSVVGVFERGIPHQERIVISVNEIVSMGQFGLLLGIRQQEGAAFPIRDNFFWFGDGYLSRGDWIFVYTGPGDTRVVELPGTIEKLYSLHWGRENVVLSPPEIVPILVRVDAVDIPTETQLLPSP